MNNDNQDQKADELFLRANREALMLVLDFIDSDEEGKISLLRKYPIELLDNDNIERIFTWLITNSQIPEKKELIDQNRKILSSCRESGIGNVFPNATTSSNENFVPVSRRNLVHTTHQRTEPTREQEELSKIVSKQLDPYNPAIFAFAKAQTPDEKKRIVEEKACWLLTSSAYWIFEGFLLRSEGKLQVYSNAKRDQDILVKCREEGIEVAFGGEVSTNYRELHLSYQYLIELVDSCRFPVLKYKEAEPNIAATELITLHYALKEIEYILINFSRELGKVVTENNNISYHLKKSVSELDTVELHFRKLQVWIERRRIKHGYFARNWTEFLLNDWEKTLLDHEAPEVAVRIGKVKQIIENIAEDISGLKPIDVITIKEIINFTKILSGGLTEFERSIFDFIIENHLEKRYAITEICNVGHGSGDNYKVGIPLYRHKDGDILDLVCPICQSTVRVRIGKHEFEGHVQGTNGDDVSKVVRELVKDIEKMGDKVELRIGDNARISGDLIMANSIDNSFNKLDSSNLTSELKELLKQLSVEVGKIIEQLPTEEARDVADDLETLIEKTTCEKPKRKWWSVSIDGLGKAAKKLGKIGVPTLELIGKIVPLLEHISS